MLGTNFSGAYRKDELYEGLLTSLDLEFGAKASDVAQYIDDPVGFAREVIGCKPTKDQVQILEAVAQHGHVAVRSGHGIGKSTAMSLVALWFLATRPHSKIPMSAPTSHQLFDILWSEMIKWYHQMKKPYKDMFAYTSEMFYHKNYRESWAIFPRTARPDKPESLQGFHAKHLLFLLDEAAGIDNRIFEVAEGALTSKDNFVLMAGNPTRLSGFFYDAFHRDRRIWKTMYFSSLDSPLVNKKYPKRMAKKYGETSNVYRVRVLGDFPTSEEDQLIGVDLLEAAVDRHIPLSGDLTWGLDPARFGSDATALVKRRGDTVLSISTVRGYNTMQTVGWVVSQVEDDGNRPSTIFVDTIGIGGGIADRLRELGYPAVDVNVGEKSGTPDKYFNLRAELWCAYRDWLAEGHCSLPDDEALIAESSTIKYSFDSAGRIKIEKKEDMKKRGLPSPDRADALCLTFYEPQFLFSNLRLWKRR
jgi:hypothetical protein